MDLSSPIKIGEESLINFIDAAPVENQLQKVMLDYVKRRQNYYKRSDNTPSKNEKSKGKDNMLETSDHEMDDCQGSSQ